MLFGLISQWYLLNGTKPGRTRDGMELGRVAAIFKMAAILDCFQLVIYPILFNLSISTSMQHLMLFGLISLYLCWMSRSAVVWRPSLKWQPYCILFQLALYLILFSISTSISMQHLMLFGLISLWYLCWMSRSPVAWRPSLKWRPYWTFFSWHYIQYCSVYQYLSLCQISCL